MENNYCQEYHDVVHGRIEVCGLIEAIINSDLFQRLKEIKQLGGMCFINSEANHTRFEHCIGTYFLADKMLKSLIVNTPGLSIPKFYQNCVKIAGLLHDIGHGPFSHFWEQINPTSHEDNSKDCIDEIFQNLNYSLSKCEKRHYFGVELIKALIKGDKTIVAKLFDRNFEFLFDIINNKKCDVDVDKWDYLKRDAHYVGHCVPQSVTYNLNFDEVFLTATVSQNRSHISYNFNVLDKIYDIFDTRSKFHIHLYQMPLSRAAEYILKEAVKLADAKGYKYDKLDGKLLSEVTSHNTKLYLQLTDNNIINFLRQIKDNDIARLISCLDNKNIITTEIDNNSDNTFFSIPIKIEHAGQKMNKENIPFHGDSKEQSKIFLKRGYYEAIHYFILGQ